MKNIFYKFSGLIILMFFLAVPLLPINAANLNDAFRVDSGDIYSNQDRLDSAAYNARFNIAGNAGALTPEQIISTAITALLSLLGVIFVALIVFSGFSWMIADGDEQKVTKAKGMIRESLIGLVIVLGAYAVSYFVIGFLMPGSQMGAF
ncbi:hypothetical protein COX21_02950 [Candidatus Falkowbacteria bacterium CG23_combo_of_CG06-09_8_20_14_all_41_10]|uniref:Uncharacterized protein n=1 Tax=Candidatus Falkowbacteria bacterium CG23_combo_of_CG06-09_8_20_14_all_41_10 TaxID=1974571 RepID=A0A2G9ZMW1_9BACT|nr:MAG: hypothetical protein COX21_02950 [Candidatus Falkowbacteria bacterium CG23_combo_of_CG06-09_8_20_14_all_41_10]